MSLCTTSTPFFDTPGMATLPPPWASHSNTWTFFQRKSFSWYWVPMTVQGRSSPGLESEVSSSRDSTILLTSDGVEVWYSCARPGDPFHSFCPFLPCYVLLTLCHPENSLHLSLNAFHLLASQGSDQARSKDCCQKNTGNVSEIRVGPYFAVFILTNKTAHFANQWVTQSLESLLRLELEMLKCLRWDPLCRLSWFVRTFIGHQRFHIWFIYFKHVCSWTDILWSWYTAVGWTRYLLVCLIIGLPKATCCWFSVLQRIKNPYILGILKITSQSCARHNAADGKMTSLPYCL